MLVCTLGYVPYASTLHVLNIYLCVRPISFNAPAEIFIYYTYFPKSIHKDMGIGCRVWFYGGINVGNGRSFSRFVRVANYCQLKFTNPCKLTNFGSGVLRSMLMVVKLRQPQSQHSQ